MAEEASAPTPAEAKERLEQALFEIRRVIAGQDAMLERVLVCLLSQGHLLLEGEDVLAEACARGGVESTIAPYEATAALAMLLLRDHGILTVHFAALPPGTSALLLKFLPPETLERFGGPDRFAAAVDESLDALAAVVADRGSLAGLLGLSVLSAKS